MDNGYLGQGETAALTAAALWAIATVLFGRLGKTLSPLVLNLVKGGIAIAFISLTLVLRSGTAPQLPGASVLWLVLSGAIGIGLGDTAYFSAVNHLGPRRALLMECLAPPLSAVLALVFLKETLSAIAWVGIFLTLLGVSWVISEGVPAAGAGVGLSPRRGIVWGALAALGQASGAVMSRAALANTAVDPLWSSLLRLGAGVGVLLFLLLGRGQGRAPFQGLRSPQIWPVLILTAFLGTYLAIWLQQVAFKYASTGIAQSLTATSPLFVLPIAALLGERVTGRAVLGVLVALAGIWLLVSN
ncbi:DMT family transporter [Leptolyngbya sp. PCC 6406]|uniref:DMT family transporter n=1 Tax=Leptolyngbya sp. PCC 6406 TaxID=1173264 RepID=UPI0002ACCD8E|nr:DMT family transporter [Leptolyngbya sp. PCC 6406]